MKSDNVSDLINSLKECIELQESSLQLGDTEAFKLPSDNFHDILYKYADNSRLYDASIRIRSLFSILTNIYQNFVNMETIVFKEHTDIFAAIKEGDLDKAVFLMENHFEHAKTYLLDNIKKREAF